MGSTAISYCKAPNGDYLLNKASVGNSPIFVAESLVTVKNCFLYVKIVNFNKSPVQLCDNHILSKIETLSDSDSLFAIDECIHSSANPVQSFTISEKDVPDCPKNVYSRQLQT